MKRIILKALFVVFFIVLLTLLTLPKFLLLDKALSKGGLYLTAEKVEEGLTYINLRKVNSVTKPEVWVSVSKRDICPC